MEPEAVVVAIVEKLRDAGAPTEVRVAALRGAFGRVKLRPVGEVWRLGALCLADDGTVFATGDVIVVTPPTHPNHRSTVALHDGLGVIWTPGGAAVPLAAYLAERAQLLIHPPAGANG